MPVAAGSTLERDAAEAVVSLASGASSLHNTQPWRWQFQLALAAQVWIVDAEDR